MDCSDLFLRACRRQPVPRTPVWFMRQAGRYMKEYRELRSRYSLLELCQTPELAAMVTLRAVEKLGVDAAIIFADLLLPLQAMGLRVDFVEHEGPVISRPVRTADSIRRLREGQDGELSYVADAITLVCRELDGKVPVIGFCGGPFTVASYMIEGGASRNYLKTKRLMYQEPQLWATLMGKLVKVLSKFLQMQVRAGAAALQVFDSWVGCLSPQDYRQYVLPHSRELIRNGSSSGVPVIHFGTGTAALLELMQGAGGDVMGVDWRVELDEAWHRLGYQVAIQGNLDPVVLFGPRKKVQEQVEVILRSVQGRAGHIFNLGHGILPGTPVENVQAVVEMVHGYSARNS